VALIQIKGNSTTSGTTVPLAFTSNVTAGNLLIAVTGSGLLGSGGLQSVADTQGNVWTQGPGSSSIDSTTNVTVWWAIAKSSGPDTITLSCVGAGTLDLIIAEYSVVAVIQPDQSNATINGGSSSTTFPTGSITTTQAAELILAIGLANTLGLLSTDGGFTPELQVNNNGDGFNKEAMVLADQTVAAIGTYQSNVSTAGNSTEMVAGIISFFAAAAPVGPPNLKITLRGVKRFVKETPATAETLVELPEAPHVKRAV